MKISPSNFVGLSSLFLSSPHVAAKRAHERRSVDLDVVTGSSTSPAASAFATDAVNTIDTSAKTRAEKHEIAKEMKKRKKADRKHHTSDNKHGKAGKSSSSKAKKTSRPTSSPTTSSEPTSYPTSLTHKPTKSPSMPPHPSKSGKGTKDTEMSSYKSGKGSKETDMSSKSSKSGGGNAGKSGKASEHEYTWDFNDGVFPMPPYWTTGGAGEWSIDEEVGGVIKSPVLDPRTTMNVMQEEAAAGVRRRRMEGEDSLNMSNATLTLPSSFMGGTMYASILPSVSMPVDIMIIYVNHREEAFFENYTVFTEIEMELEAGETVIDFAYIFNPFDLSLDELPEEPDHLEGASWIDYVTIVEGGQSNEPTSYPTWYDDDNNDDDGDNTYFPTQVCC